MFEPSGKFENALQFTRFDDTHPLSTASDHPIELDGRVWPTAEHYYQANKFTRDADVAQIAGADTPLAAHKLGNRWFKRKRSDFKKVRTILMTRALYIKACTYPEIKTLLLGSGDQLIAEMSQYDHYWGIGRDQRGENQMGRIWMDIRKKFLQSEQEASAARE